MTRNGATLAMVVAMALGCLWLGLDARLRIAAATACQRGNVAACRVALNR